MSGPHDETLRRFEEALAATTGASYNLTLFVSGASDLSAVAITNARELCETYLPGPYHLSIVNLYEHPIAPGSPVVAAPTLVKNAPLPVRRFIGDLSRTDRVLQALDLPVPIDHRGPHT
jgi:circadian clock protein KaiB